MLINKTVILSYAIVFLLGIVFSQTILQKNDVKTLEQKPTVVLSETVDTNTTLNVVEFKAPAKIKIKSSFHPNTLILQDSGGSNSSPAVKDNFVACLDTTLKGGFEAHVCYDSETNHFFNSFVLPETTIAKEKIITVDNTKEIIRTEMPTYLIGVGIKTYLKENTINTIPFLSLSANKKLWFFIASVEVKALTRLSAGSLKMEPELEGKINVPL